VQPGGSDHRFVIADAAHQLRDGSRMHNIGFVGVFATLARIGMCLRGITARLLFQ